VPGFIARKQVPAKMLPQTDRWTHLGLAAAQQALDDAEVDLAGLPEFELAVVTAASSGGAEFGQHEMERLWRQGPQYVGAYQSIAWFYAAATGQISIWQRMRGPCGVVAAEQTGGLVAIGQARRLLRSQARLVVTGGTDASLCPYGLVAQFTSGLLSRADDPARGYLPFDVAAAGYIPGEGGAMLVLEDAEAARTRGAPREYGEITGCAFTFDPLPGSGRPPTLRTAIEGALIDATTAPEEIDVVFADAFGVPELDRLEAEALAEVFGPRGVLVTAPKTMTGRLYAGGAPLDLVSALLAIRDSVIPPVIGITQLAPGCDLDLVRDTPLETTVRTALVLARGYGGFNAALVVRGNPKRTRHATRRL
jgi:act minimal PKS chain-length factor (CLF/KS beta)